MTHMAASTRSPSVSALTLCASTYGSVSPTACSLVSWRDQQKTVTTGGTREMALLGLHSKAFAAGRVFQALAPIRRPSIYAARLCLMTSSILGSKAISIGERLPDADLSYFDKEGNLQTISIAELTKGKKVVLFAVPGAFTPTCSQRHLPGFVEKAEELRSKGVDTIACISVNDTFVMKAWGESLGVGDKVLLLSDGNAIFTRALGVTVDLSDKPALLGVRSRRYALLAEDGVVKVLNLEEGGAFTVSGPDEILKQL